jgi:hypothetical protein
MGQIGGCAWCGSSASAGVPSALQAMARALHADLLRCLVVFFVDYRGGAPPTGWPHTTQPVWLSAVQQAACMSITGVCCAS